MLSDCLKGRKKTESKKPKVEKIKRRKNNASLKLCWYFFDICDNKRSRFIKEKEVGGLLSTLGIKTILVQIPIVGSIF